MRAALYARYSTDNQSDTSVEDQLVLCRRFAEKVGARVVHEYSDAAISGQALGNRPGVRALLEAARCGQCDLVVAEHTDRLSRAGSGGWEIYEDLKALGVRYITVNQGEITAMHVGMSGTMSVMMIEEGARKTRRGLEGVVRSGRSAGGLSYGYAVRREYDAKGEPIRGLREIVPAEAEVVMRIFGAYACGDSPQRIAAGLNRDALPGPSGGMWNASTIAGNAKRGNGVLHNELYRGVTVFGRHAWSRDRRTGARRARSGAAEAILRHDAPELRIVSEELWEKVRARYQSVTKPGGRPEGARRPKRLLSGLIHCGCCGGKMNLTGPGSALRCHNRIERGVAVCDNARTPAYAGVEARVLAAIQAQLLHPDVVEAAMTEMVAERRRRSQGDARRRQKLEAELAEVKRRAARLIDKVADGELSGAAIKDRLMVFEQQRSELERDLAAPALEIALPHPGSPRGYRKIVERLSEALALGDGLAEAGDVRELLRELIREVHLHPLAVQGSYRLEIHGDLAVLVDDDKAGSVSGTGLMSTLGAGTGFEPVTFRL